MAQASKCHWKKEKSHLGCRSLLPAHFVLEKHLVGRNRQSEPQAQPPFHLPGTSILCVISVYSKREEEGDGVLSSGKGRGRDTAIHKGQAGFPCSFAHLSLYSLGGGAMYRGSEMEGGFGQQGVMSHHYLGDNSGVRGNPGERVGFFKGAKTLYMAESWKSRARG